MRVIGAVLGLCLLASCAYDATLQNETYTPKTAVASDKRINLDLAVVADENLLSRKFQTAAAGYSVEIRYGQAMVDALKAEFEGVFRSVTIVPEAKASEDPHRAFAVIDFDWRERYRDERWGNFKYDYAMAVEIRDHTADYALGRYAHKGQTDYSAPASAHAAQALTGASLFVLAPITVPATTQAVGAEAEDVFNRVIKESVQAIRKDVAEDGSLRHYAFNPGVPGGPTQVGKQSEKPPASAFDDLMDAVVVVAIQGGQGSGFFVTQSGYLITNKHVVKDYKFADIGLRDGTIGQAQVIAVAPDTDLALLRTTLEPPALLRLSPGGEARIGQDVIAIGAPKGLAWTISKGIVSAFRNGTNERQIQTDAAVNQGNSGGPLIDAATRKVIGVNTWGIKQAGVEGLNFAISSEDVLFRFGKYIAETSAAN